MFLFKIGIRLAFITLILDQFSKWYLLNVVQMEQRGLIEITDFFNLRMVWNKGVSFGMFSADSQVGRYVLIGFALLIIGFLVVWLMRAQSRWLAAGLGLVIGGALGNVIDRFIYGAVADFFDFHALGTHFYAFNVADTAISIGVALLVFDSIFMGEEGEGGANGASRPQKT